jgi:hypothetical protein
MNKIVKIALSAAIMLTMGATVASADVAKGQKLYMKKLGKVCEMKGAAFAGKHSQAEWEAINKAGKLADEIKVICPAAKDKDLDNKYLEHYYDFFHEYGNDSGNVPSC